MAQQGIRLSEVFRRDGLVLNLEAAKTEDALRRLVSMLAERGALAQNQIGMVVKTLMKREELGSTAIGKGIAVPHAKHGAVREIVGCLAISPTGVEFNALDSQPVHVIFMVLSPPESADEHIQVLRKIIEFVKDQDMLRFLRHSKDETAMAELLVEADLKLAQGA